METAKLNGVNPQEWLANILDRIGKAPRSTGSTNCYRGNGPPGRRDRALFG
ncbi:transposase domain-containing protein [Novosphingobium sp. BL-52-GroH]|uniref:transposase domain-containing protein n=1 Tax=Novosphingobium sp. BL-52-GroH TaxID=3349877 RepID=UPI00384E9A5F